MIKLAALELSAQISVFEDVLFVHLAKNFAIFAVKKVLLPESTQRKDRKVGKTKSHSYRKHRKTRHCTRNTKRARADISSLTHKLPILRRGAYDGIFLAIRIRCDATSSSFA